MFIEVWEEDVEVGVLTVLLSEFMVFMVFREAWFEWAS